MNSQNPSPPITKVIGSFINGLTRFEIGTMDSGWMKFNNTWGDQTYFNVPSLSFNEAPVQLSSADLTETDLIVAGKVRVESGITYLYCIASTGKLFKIAVNDVATVNPNKNTITKIATLTAGSCTFKYGASMTFGIITGTTEGIYIGHDTGVTKIGFDGSSETYIGSADSTHWIVNSPRGVISFGQYLYFLNGQNIAEYSLASLTVTSYQKISPGFPSNYQAMDIDVTNDGRYIIISVSRTSQIDLTGTTVNTSEAGATDSIIFYWNGTDTAASSFTTIPNFAITAYHTFQNNEFSFGYDALGACVYRPLTKDLTMLFNDSPNPNAIGSSGNMLGWTTSEFDTTDFKRKVSLYIYGKNEREIPEGLSRLFRMSAKSPQTDIIRCLVQILATGAMWSSYDKYPNSSYSSATEFFSTVETNGSTSAYRFYFFNLLSVGIQNKNTNAQIETQTELFSERVRATEVRFFIAPTAGTSFQSVLVGADGNAITGGSHTFTPASTEDMVKYTPTINPVGAMALRIINKGTGITAPTIRKVEIDLVQTGA